MVDAMHTVMRWAAVAANYSYYYIREYIYYQISSHHDVLIHSLFLRFSLVPIYVDVDVFTFTPSRSNMRFSTEVLLLLGVLVDVVLVEGLDLLQLRLQ